MGSEAARDPAQMGIWATVNRVPNLGSFVLKVGIAKQQRNNAKSFEFLINFSVEDPPRSGGHEPPEGDSGVGYGAQGDSIGLYGQGASIVPCHLLSYHSTHLQ